MTRKLTTHEFINNAIAKHGDKYNYSMVKYNGRKNKVIIICKIHGEFELRCDRHLEGKGCQKCSQTNKLTKEEFLHRAKKVHGDKYDYSLVVCDGVNSKIKIICKKHGIFEQILNVHVMQGSGCQKCKNETLSKLKTITKEEFIQKSKEIHDNIYDYSNIEYINASTKIEIFCNKHGIFTQIPSFHMRGRKCPKCSNEYTSNNKILSNEEFIQRANEKHDCSYDYSFVEYKGTKDKVKIICDNGHTFLQTPNDHLNGCGCSYCITRISKGENEVYEYIKEIYNGKIIIQDKSVLRPKHLDIYIPDLKLAIEYNGVYYHSMKFNPKKNHDIHLEKYLGCKQKDIDLIQIFEDEWKNKNEKIKKYLYNRINNLDTLTGNIMNNRFPNHKLYVENGYKELYVSSPLIYDNKEFLIYDAGRTVWARKD